VQTERVWDFATTYQTARIIVINKLDRDNSSFERTLASLQESFGREVVPIQLPIGSEQDFRGVVDLVTQKAFVYSRDGKGNAEEQPVPEEMQSEVESRREALIEMVAENDDSLMERFFEEGTLTDQELSSGLKKAISQGAIYPVLSVSLSRPPTILP
jgi:elongation factor G